MSMETRFEAEYAAIQKTCAHAINRARGIIDREIYEILDCVETKSEQPILDAWDALKTLITKEEIQCGINYRRALNQIEEEPSRDV